MADMLDAEPALVDNPKLAGVAVGLFILSANRLESWRGVAGEPLRNALTAHADSMVNALGKVYAPAVAELEAARGVIGDELPLTASTQILQLGPAGAEAWNKAVTAAAFLVKCIQAVKQPCLHCSPEVVSAGALVDLARQRPMVGGGRADDEFAGRISEP